MWVGTFHAIGARMLRAAPHLVGRTASFTIYDQDDTQSVVKRIMERHQLNTKQFTPRGIQYRMLRAAPHLVGRTASFTIYDQDDTQSVVKRIMERHQLNTKQFTPRGI